MNEFAWNIFGPTCIVLALVFWWLDRRKKRREVEEWAEWAKRREKSKNE